MALSHMRKQHVRYSLATASQLAEAHVTSVTSAAGINATKKPVLDAFNAVYSSCSRNRLFLERGPYGPQGR